MKLNQLYQLINEVLNKPKKDGCDCGCGGCDNAPILTESKVKNLLSEGLQYHIDTQLPLHETIYRYGSEKHLTLIKEARKLYSRNVINLNEQDIELIKTNLGEWDLYEGESVPLDLPMINEIIPQGDSRKEDFDSYFHLLDIIGQSHKKYRKELSYDQFLAYLDTKTNFNHPSEETYNKALEDLKSGNLEEKQLDEKKKDPPIGKPKRGGSKAYYVYVRDPKTKRVKKVSFGSGGLRAKINNPKARQAFAKRHRCSEKNDRTKPSYWSCRLPRYAKALGLGNNKNTFW